MSGAEAVPSWDEFNVAANDEELDYEEDAGDPAAHEEFGPTLPPGFNGDLAPSNPLNDLNIPIDNDDDEPDDPEDPQDPHHSARRVIGPAIPSVPMPPRSNGSRQNAEDAFTLPSITSSADFEPRASSSGTSSRHIGPALPPDIFGLPDQSDSTLNGCAPPDEPQSSPSSSTRNGSSNGGQRTSAAIGPTLPSEFLPTVSSSTNNSQSSRQHIGPSLPPDLCGETAKAPEDLEDGVIDEPSTSPIPGPSSRNEEPDAPSSSRTVGPSLPPNFAPMELPMEEEDNQADGAAVNNAMEDEETDVIGPMPPSSERSAEEQALYFQRLMEFEAKQAQNSGPKREEWMTELPKKMKASYGLSARTFSRVNGPSSSGSSAWTATPNGNTPAAVKADAAETLKSKRQAERDKLEEAKAEKLNQNRSESLMEQHSRKRKAETGNGTSSSGINVGGRRTFSRDSDMEVRGLAVNAEEVKKRMGSLTSRFGHGNSQKFL